MNREDSYDEESDDDEDKQEQQDGDQDDDEEQKGDDNNELGGELNELEGLGGGNMMDDNQVADYVEVSVNDTRRSRQIQQDMINQLAKKEDEKKKASARPSRANMMARQSFLLSTSFAPVKPIVQTATAFTQTDTEPMKMYQTSDT